MDSLLLEQTREPEENWTLNPKQKIFEFKALNIQKNDNQF
uniref:Uncharacterized protein n=1 Tax=Methylophaga nitratireducenticrescens TaxID=754476 RepID=I1XM65_METNJ